MAAISYTIQGHAIVSADDKIADSVGAMPAQLRNSADWRRFQSSLARAAIIVLGRMGHLFHANVHRRPRLVMSTSARALERRSDAWWWNPAQATLAEALAASAPAGGLVAVPGGRRVFDYFLEHGYDEFHLARMASVTIPDGVPLFTECASGRTGDSLLAEHGLDPQSTETLDARARVTLTIWKRVEPGT
jgi:dihydrofolate reductase